MKCKILFLTAVCAISVAAQPRKPSKACYIGRLTADGHAYLEPTRCSLSNTPSAKRKTPLRPPPATRNGSAPAPTRLRHCIPTAFAFDVPATISEWALLTPSVKLILGLDPSKFLEARFNRGVSPPALWARAPLLPIPSSCVDHACGVGVGL